MMESTARSPSRQLQREDSAPPSYLDIIDSAPAPPTHSISVSTDNEELIRYVTAVGISDEWARLALRTCNGNVDAAIRLCIDSGALDSPSQTSTTTTTRPTTKKKKSVVTRTLGAFKRSSEKSDRPEQSERQHQPPSSLPRTLPHPLPTPTPVRVPVPVPVSVPVPVPRQLPPAATVTQIQNNLPPEPPPSYHALVGNPAEAAPAAEEDDFPDLPSYDEIIFQSPTNAVSVTENVSDRAQPPPPQPPPPPPRLVSEQLATPPSPVHLESANITNQTANSELQSTQSNSLPENTLPISPTAKNSKVLVPPLLLSQTQMNSRRNLKSTTSSDEISPVYTSGSGDYSYDCSDIVVEEMRNNNSNTDTNEEVYEIEVAEFNEANKVNEDFKENEVHEVIEATIEATTEADVSEISQEGTEHDPTKTEDVVLLPETPQDLQTVTEENNIEITLPSYENVTEYLPAQSLLTSPSRGSTRISVLSFEDVVSSDDDSSQTEEDSRGGFDSARRSTRGGESFGNMVTLIDRDEEGISPNAQVAEVEVEVEVAAENNYYPTVAASGVAIQEVPVPTTVPSPSSSQSTTTTSTSSSPERNSRQRSRPPSERSSSSSTRDASQPAAAPQVENSRPNSNRPQAAVGTRSNTQSQTLPAQLPSQRSALLSASETDNLSTTATTPPRPQSVSRLPQATAILDDDNMDDDTIHGEAFVQVSLGSGVLGTAVADLYLRGESGNLYMAVAAPLTNFEEDDNPHATTVRGVNARDGDDSNQNRGIFSYARNRLYGEERTIRREVAGGVRRRVFLPFDIEEREGKFYPVLRLSQPKLGPNSGPQHNRPLFLRMSPSSSRELSIRHAEVNIPPLWDGGNDPKECSICFHSAGFLYKIHHCRNCGHYVCNNCSQKDWPASMLPKTYVPERESVIRVCDNCSYLQEGFMDALRVGDLNRSMTFYLTGNVNLHCPMSIYKSEEFPIHTAVQGGNIHLVRWIIEDRRCSLRDGSGAPLTTTEGLSPLAIAAFYGHRDIMIYLVQEHGCHVTEIKDSTILLRGLHAALESPGDLPEVGQQSSLGSLFGKRGLPGELETVESGVAHTGAPVPAQLATGNRNISNIPTTVAEMVPTFSISEPTGRPKLATGKRRTIAQPSLSQTRKTLAETSRIMQQTATTTTTTETEGDAPARAVSADVSDIQRAITAPYTDDDISVMTTDMMDQYRELTPRGQNTHDRGAGHRRGRSLHSSSSTVLAVNNMSPASSVDSTDRSPNPRYSSTAATSDTSRQLTRFEVNSANLSRSAPPPHDDDDNESVDTLMTSTSHTFDPADASRMSMRAANQSFARLEAEEREAQRILSRAASSSRTTIR